MGVFVGDERGSEMPEVKGGHAHYVGEPCNRYCAGGNDVKVVATFTVTDVDVDSFLDSLRDFYHDHNIGMHGFETKVLDDGN